MSISDRMDEIEAIDLMRERLDLDEALLQSRVREVCPGEHKTVQHRDSKSPWCPHCGCTDRGERIKHVDQ